MKILVVGNLSNRRCGFATVSDQTATALQHAGHDVTRFDGTYSVVYARQQENAGPYAFLPDDAHTYDVLHVIYHAITFQHYAGATWPAGPVLSLWNGGPADSYCPFGDPFHVRWSTTPRDGHRHDCWYPIPDWITDLPAPNTDFTVGVTGVREEGFGPVEALCQREGWIFNRGEPNAWLPLEDEVRRLAKSTVNVCWYGPQHQERASAVMTSIASRRPQVLTDVTMFSHLVDDGIHAPDLYWALTHSLGTLDTMLHWVHTQWREKKLVCPSETIERLGWRRMAAHFESVWRAV